MRPLVFLHTVFLFILLCGGGCVAPRNGYAGADPDSCAMPEDECDLTVDALAWADSVALGMTAEERVGQLFIPAIYASDDPFTLQRLLEYHSLRHVGGVVLLKGDMRSAAVMADTLAARCADGEGIMPFMAIDAEWGLGMRLRDAPGFPLNSRLGELSDEQLMYDYGREMARECRSLGITMVLGPVADVSAGGDGVMRLRSFGGDAGKVADLVVAYSRGLEDGNVVSVAKHFPGHGSPSGDSHRTLPAISRTLSQLDSVDLLPFRRYVEAGLSAVMVGHLVVPAIDSEPLPAAVSPAVVGTLLRGDLGFRGLVLTDALNMEGAAGYGPADAVAAGADMVVAPVSVARGIEDVLRAVEEGRITEDEILAHCRRILFYKYLAGLSESRRIDVASGISEVTDSRADSLRSRLRRAAR